MSQRLYNIGGITERANLEVVGKICSLLDAKAPRKDGLSYSETDHVCRRPMGHDRRYAVDCAKIQKELGWNPSESFETGLAKTVDWYLSHREWCADITGKRYARERLGTKS